MEFKHDESQEKTSSQGFSIDGYMSSKRIVEINLENAIMNELRKRDDANKNYKSVKNLVMLPFDIDLLTLGFITPTPLAIQFTEC